MQTKPPNLSTPKPPNPFPPTPYLKIQEALRTRVIRENQLPNPIKYIAGADVAYDEEAQTMIGAVVVLDAETLTVIEEQHAVVPITFPYIPGLFSFREIPALKAAYQKIALKPDLIICDGQGIAHPKGVGMASHLGIELDVPTIGCAKNRLTGKYDKTALKKPRGSRQSLLLDGTEVGAALRTQDGIKPLFVSIGHKIDLPTAIDWVLHACNKYRQPETTRRADGLVNRLRRGER